MSFCLFRVTQDLLEDLVFLVWMDVMEPKEAEDTLGFQENKDQMVNG